MPPQSLTTSLHRTRKFDSHQGGPFARICICRRVRSCRHSIHVSNPLTKRRICRLSRRRFFDTFVFFRNKIAGAEDLPCDLHPRSSAIVLNVRLLTLTESTAHPLAKNPRFDIFLKSRSLLWCTLDAQIAGDSLVILTCHDRSCDFDEIHLVYWKECTVHCVCMSSSSTARD